MTIKNRLTLQFVSLSSLIMAVSLLAIYLLSENYREEEFYNRLSNRSVNIAKILIDVDEIDEKLLYKIEKDNPVRLHKESVRIYNFRNEPIFTLDEQQTTESDTLLLSRIRLDSTIKFSKGNREYLGVLFTGRYDRFVIVASAEDVYGLRKISNLGKVSMVVFAISMLIMFFAGRIYAFQALQPLNKLIEETEAITPANLEKRLGEGNSKDEIGMLAHSFNLMLSRVEAAFKTQKNFIANASHEMRTPLTSISGQIEVVLLKKRTVEEYKQSLDSVLDDMHNLNSLANRLLLLAQTETNSQESSFSTIRVDESIWSAVSDLKRMKKNCQIDIHFDPNLDDELKFQVHGSELLLKTMMINLLENGCKYSDDNKVCLVVRSEASTIIVEFSDNGIGISKDDLNNVFEPFFRGENVGTRSGHGIGLSLVKRIVDMHNGAIEISSALNIGTVIVVRLPNA